MTDTKLNRLIADAVALDREVREKSERLKELKAELVAEAESRGDEHQAVDGSAGGVKWSRQGADGCAVRVIWPSPKLKSSINPTSKQGEKVVHLAGTSKLLLFTPKFFLEPVAGFRDLARMIFGGKAEKLIALCESASAPRVEFETKPE